MILSELAAALGATLDGEGSTEITGIAGIEAASSGQVTFVSNKKYTALARTTRASAILVTPDFPEIPVATLRIADPYLAYARTIELFYQPPAYPPGIHPTAVISPTATIGPRAHIGAYVVIADHVSLGAGTTLHPHVVLYPYVTAGDHFTAHAHVVVREHCRVGNNVTLQNGAVIGADGFGFARTASGWYKILQSGPAVLEDDVEIQANACVDRASIGETRVRRGAKVDNLVQVGHGSIVGEDTLLCAQVGLAGSTEVGRNVILAGQVGVAGHCVIGDGVVATRPKRHPQRRPTRKDSQRLSRGRQPPVAAFGRALFNRLPELLRNLRRS